MKYWITKKTHQFRQKPFVVLPITERIFKSDRKTSAFSKNKKMGLKLVTRAVNRNASSSPDERTSTWPPKARKSKKESLERPLTATLDKPKLLDISLIGVLDMSLVRKEFLAIPNLCKPIIAPVTLVEVKHKSSDTSTNKHALPVVSKARMNEDKGRLDASGKGFEEDTISVPINARTAVKTTNKICSSSEHSIKVSDKTIKKKSKSVNKDNNNNRRTIDTNNAINNKTNHEKNITNVNKKQVSPLSCVSDSKIKLPAPCKTCGRPDQPERFHSHPPVPLLKKSRENSPTIASSNTNKSKSQVVLTPRSISSPRRKIVSQAVVNEAPSPIRMESPNNNETSKPKSASKRPRTLVCYLCGREFGTASLPLHEPKCLQKWERENEQLPPRLRRQPPVKPDKNMSLEEWNEFAWKTSQASLIPCEGCGRTFLPDRLEVHQRSCKRPNKPSKKETGDAPMTGPPSVACYICGRRFGTKSIFIHEPQCLKKWQLENSQLPASQRRAEPTRPDVVLTESGKIDIEATSEANWKAHLDQLVACEKCGRKFTPDRVQIHERSCKATGTNHD